MRKNVNCGESVIRVNSIYMEIIDKFYKQAGTNTWLVVVLFFGFSECHLL